MYVNANETIITVYSAKVLTRGFFFAKYFRLINEKILKQN